MIDKKFNVLVTDDEPDVRGIMADFLRALGEEYIPYLASNGFEALGILKRIPIDFAFLDQNMDEMTGVELLNHIRQHYVGVLVVIITGQPSYSLVLEALRHQAVDFISKPFALEDLKVVLERLKKEKYQREEREGLSSQSKGKKVIDRLHSQIDKMTREQGILCTIFQNLGNIRSTEGLYQMILEAALDLTGACQSAFMMLDHDGDRLELIDSLGANDLSPLFWQAAHKVVRNQAPVFIKGRSKETPRNTNVRIGLAIPLLVRGEIFGTLIVGDKPHQGFNAEDLFVLNLLAERFSLTLENLALYESMTTNLYDTLRSLVNSLEARDLDSSQHSERVTHLSLHFAQKLGRPQEELDSIRFAGYLHDIGKVGIRDAILLKPGKLTPEERAIIQTHPLIGVKIVEPLRLLPREKAIILHHHERWDGKGYPFGLAGEEIPLLARILSLADTYDALTSDRFYRNRLTHQDALQEIQANAGSQFDPELACRFIQIMKESPLLPYDRVESAPPDFPCQIIDSPDKSASQSG